ncbi:MAG: hypothetical protein C4K49_09320 [Candidatus Thorarchaeota archaeon]|nr:MAG: hypothetical protein C4K49_09320 [Candidatus Thorarchaeota archaeon]
MGLYDSSRRKKTQHPEFKPVARGRESVRTEGPRQGAPTAKPVVTGAARSAVRSETASLLAEYRKLVQRRGALTAERAELTTRLERGEITTAQFHKELRAKIQEAARVSENLSATAARLSELGYSGLAP